MSIKKRPIKGISYWIIDRSFRRPSDGVIERYRRVAQVQTRASAEREERDIIAFFEAHGTIAPLVRPELRPKAEPKKVEMPKKDPTWEDAVEHYTEIVAPTRKSQTWRGYEGILEGPHMKWWASMPLSKITRREIQRWDATLPKSGSGSTRRNQHIVLRSVLRAVGPTDDGEPGILISEMPRFPRLPKVGQVAVDAPDPDDVKALLTEVDDEKRLPVRSRQRRSARLAFALASYAGLRAGETRGLRVRDIKGGNIVVRVSRAMGIDEAPKSGHQRVIPIDGRLLPLLKRATEGKGPDDYVCTKIDGTPWGDTGLRQALERACKRLGISGGRYHALRHHFATALFGGGADAITVRDLLGHADLKTTQRYAHGVKARARAAIAAMASVALIMLGCGASVHDDYDNNTCDWRFLPSCVVRGEEGDACQSEAFCQDGLRCDRPSDDRRTWTCVLDD